MTQTVKMVFAQLMTVKEQLDQLNQKKRELEAQLQAMVPENESLEGVRHVRWETPSISYSKVVEAIRDLLDIAGQQLLEEVIEQHTKVTERHRIAEDKDAA